MKKPIIKFVATHSEAILPKRAHNTPMTGDSGYDLFSVSEALIPARGSVVIPIGLKVGYIEPGFWFRIEGRSGLGFKHSVQPHFGVIDNPYRGDMGVKVYNQKDEDYFVKKGDAIAQMIVYELIEPELSFTDEVSETDRGEKGFGSSDKKEV